MRLGLKNVECYKLHTCLKKAGRVEIWKSIDSSLRRYVIIKLIHAAPVDDPGFLARFTHETRVLSSLHHPNIVRIQDTRIAFPPELASPVGYLVMDYIDGPTLADEFHKIVQTGKSPSLGSVIYLIKAISGAIDYVQQKGIVHGDIQPANILLRHHSSLNMGEPVLTGFGTAKLLGTTPAVLCLWRGDMPLYLSPEQCQGDAANSRSDVYALGAMLYELFTGVAPFQGVSASEIMLQHLYVAPKPPLLINPAVAPAVSRLIMRCLEKAPAARFATASALASALGDALLPFIGELPATPAAGRASSTYISMPAHVSSRSQTVRAMFASRPAPVRSLVTPTLLPLTSTRVRDRQTWTPAPPARRVAVAFTAGSQAVDLPRSTQQIELSRVMTQPLWQPSSSMLAAPVAAPALALKNTQAACLPRVRMPSSLSKLCMVVCLAFCMAFVVSGLGANLALQHQWWILEWPAVGQLSFVNSGLTGNHNQKGVNDEVQVDLHGIPPAGTGKNYYSWLIGAGNQPHQQWLLLGTLHLNQGVAHMLFAGNRRHRDLLAFTSLFLVTTGDAQAAAFNPLLQPATWRYYAALPQVRLATSFEVCSFQA